MRKLFEGVRRIEDRELFNLMSSYCDALIDEATRDGWLAEQGADNEYTREIGRVGCLCADYESEYMTFKHIRPLRSAVRHAERRQTNYVPVTPLCETGVAVAA
jgi:hypothetical protein